MNSKEKRIIERAKLDQVSDMIIREIGLGKWDHLSSIRNKPLSDCLELIREIETRVPGRSLEDYRDAISRSAWNNR